MNNGYSVSPSAINWTLRSDKRVSDQFLIDEVVSSVCDRKTCRAMTFPAAGFLMEKELSKATPKIKWHIDAIESDAKVIRKMAVTVGLLNARRMTSDLHKGRFLQVLQQFEATADWDPSQYDFIYPDWMGTWSLEKREETASIFQRNLLRQGGVLAGTLSLLRGHGPAIEELRDFVDGEPVEVIDFRPSNRKREMNYRLRTQGIPHFIMTQAQSYGIKLEDPKVMVYDSLSDSGLRNTAQMKLVFRRSYV